MFKWFALFLILTVAVGFYWMVMSGTWADRNIDMELRGAVKEPQVSGIAKRLENALERIDNQQAMVEKLQAVARNPNWVHLEHARLEVKHLLDAASKALAEGRDEAESEAAETLRGQVRDVLPSISVETFHPQQRTFWAVLFWVFAIPAALFALLSFVRAQPS